MGCSREYYYRDSEDVEAASIYDKPVQQPTPQPDLYTQSELTYIEQLEDEIAKLNDLCSDYVKIIAEKDYRIESMQEVIDELSSMGCTNGW